MKKCLLLFAIITMALTSCSSLPSPKSNMAVIDYGVLTSKGIFVTESNSVSFTYNPIGSISIDELGGWVRKNKNVPTKKNVMEYYDEMPKSGKKEYKAPNMNDMFNKVAAQLQDMDANGIINLKINQTFEYQKEIKQFIHRVTISGMAIKK